MLRPKSVPCHPSRWHFHFQFSHHITILANILKNFNSSLTNLKQLLITYFLNTAKQMRSAEQQQGAVARELEGVSEKLREVGDERRRGER